MARAACSFPRSLGFFRERRECTWLFVEPPDAADAVALPCRDLGTPSPGVLGFATFFPPMDVSRAPTALGLGTGSGVVVKTWSLKLHILFKKHTKTLRIGAVF